jgi:hypothetical protein
MKDVRQDVAEELSKVAGAYSCGGLYVFAVFVPHDFAPNQAAKVYPVGHSQGGIDG